MLSKRLVVVASSGVLWLTCGAGVSAAPATAEQAVHSLVGTYQCVNRQSSGQIWKFTSVNDAFGAWLHVHATYPRQQGLAADTATVFIGYDIGSKRWNIVSVNADGSYYTRSSSSAVLDGSQWKDDYPGDGGRAVLRTFGAARYTFDFTLPVAKGPATTAHVVCTRTT